MGARKRQWPMLRTQRVSKCANKAQQADNLTLANAVRAPLPGHQQTLLGLQRLLAKIWQDRIPINGACRTNFNRHRDYPGEMIRYG